MGEGHLTVTMKSEKWRQRQCPWQMGNIVSFVGFVLPQYQPLSTMPCRQARGEVSNNINNNDRQSYHGSGMVLSA